MIRVYKRNILCYQIISKTLKEFESKFCGQKKPEDIFGYIRRAFNYKRAWSRFLSKL